MSAIRSLSGVKRTSPRDGCRSIQKHALRLLLTSFGAGGPHFVRATACSLMMDQQPHPAVAAVSAHFARQGEARSITCAQRRSAHHVRGWDGHCFIFPVASDLPPSSSPERRDHRRQEQAPWLTRQNPASSFPSSRGYHPPPAGRSVKRMGARGGRQGPGPLATREDCSGAGFHQPLRGRPTLHPEGCSSSCFSSSSMPSRMNDEAFLYLVYGTSSLMNSHVAWSMRKVTTRDFAFTRSPRCVRR
jgi:hypothetical protein